jgi:TPR repeat protein
MDTHTNCEVLKSVVTAPPGIATAESAPSPVSSSTSEFFDFLKWLRKAAEHGHVGAQCDLGVYYANGQGVTKDDAEAIKWFSKAAAQGEADAEYCLGSAYWLGRGVPKDSSEAVKWWRRSAQHGNAKAQNNLAALYQDGDVVPKDYVEAYKWLQFAAEQGYEGAQNCCSELAAKMSTDQLAEAESRRASILPITNGVPITKRDNTLLGLLRPAAAG